MPTYEYRCVDCKTITEAYRRVSDRNDCPICACGHSTRKIISSYRVHGDFDPYYDENLEAFVKSKQHRRKLMKDRGLSEHFGQNWYTSAIKKRSV